MTTIPVAPPLRIASIDVFRALTMVLMIFVNDLWTLTDIPRWLEHTAAEEDGLGLADVVFPAFLFIVGMSIPFSVQTRRAKGDHNGSIVLHILSRALALLIMGLFLVNGESLHLQTTGLNAEAWYSLSCLAFILIWNSYPRTMNISLKGILKVIGIAILLALVYLFHGGENGEARFETHWWGILGLIGWAYLVSALIFTFAERPIMVLTVAWILFISLCMASQAGMIHNQFLRTVLSPLGEGAMPAFTIGGVLTSLIFRHFATQGNHKKFILILFILAAVLFVWGIYLRTFWGISKIRATPAWVLICSAITIGAFIFLHWLVDLQKKEKWFWIIKPAGTNTLLCYLLPYFAYALVGTIGIGLPAMFLSGVPGLVKSVGFSLLIVMIAGVLGKLGLRVRL